MAQKMVKNDTKSGHKGDQYPQANTNVQQERKQRLAAELRANLKKRKAFAKTKEVKCDKS